MKRVLSKPRLFKPYTVLLFLMALSGCRGYESNIPDRPVYLKRNIDTENISSPGSFLYISSVKFATDRIGFGGILIIHTYENNFSAFDLACPVELRENIRIGKPDQSLISKCDSCGEKYYLIDGSGTPTKGISKERLKRYKVTVDEYNNLFVTN